MITRHFPESMARRRRVRAFVGAVVWVLFALSVSAVLWYAVDTWSAR